MPKSIRLEATRRECQTAGKGQTQMEYLIIEEAMNYFALNGLSNVKTKNRFLQIVDRISSSVLLKSFCQQNDLEIDFL